MGEGQEGRGRRRRRRGRPGEREPQRSTSMEEPGMSPSGEPATAALEAAPRMPEESRSYAAAPESDNEMSAGDLEQCVHVIFAGLGALHDLPIHRLFTGELNLAENLSVAANLFLGREQVIGGPLGWLNQGRMNTDARRLLAGGWPIQSLRSCRLRS